MTRPISQAERGRIIRALIEGRYRVKVAADGSVEAEPSEIPQKPGNDFDLVDMKR